MPLLPAVLDSLQDSVGDSAWTYPVVLVAVALDSVIPMVPGETVAITASLLAANGELSVVLVWCAAMAGSLAGDNMSYGAGAVIGRRAERRFFSSERAQQRLDWARRQLDERGAPIILAARFIPGGRTATTFTAGTLEMPWRRFVSIDAVAAALWATYATLLGFFGGRTFTETPGLALASAFAAAALITLIAELLRRWKLA